MKKENQKKNPKITRLQLHMTATLLFSGLGSERQLYRVVMDCLNENVTCYLKDDYNEDIDSVMGELYFSSNLHSIMYMRFRDYRDGVTKYIRPYSVSEKFALALAYMNLYFLLMNHQNVDLLLDRYASKVSGFEFVPVTLSTVEEMFFFTCGMLVDDPNGGENLVKKILIAFHAGLPPTLSDIEREDAYSEFEKLIFNKIVGVWKEKTRRELRLSFKPITDNSSNFKTNKD